MMTTFLRTLGVTALLLGASLVEVGCGGDSLSRSNGLDSPPAGTMLGTFGVRADPSGMAVDRDGNLWVTHTENVGRDNLTELSQAGVLVGMFSVATDPKAIAIDAKGDLWVTSADPATVTKLSSAGAILSSISLGPDLHAYGVAIDSGGNVWVASNNVDGGSVTKLDSRGEILGVFEMTTVSPMGLAIDRQDNVWISDGADSGSTVTKLRNDGVTLGTFAVGAGPDGVAVDSSDNIWVANNQAGSVTKLRNDGTALGTFVVPLTDVLGSIDVDSADNVWVTTSGEGEVTELSSEGAILGTFKAGANNIGIVSDRNAPFLWTGNFLDGTVVKLSSGGTVAHCRTDALCP